MEAFEGRGFTVDLAGDAVEILEPEGVRLTPLGRSTFGSGGRCEGGVGSFLEGAFVPVFDGVRLDTVDVAEAVEPRLARRGWGELGADFSPDAFRFLPAVALLLAETAELLDAVESVRCLGGRSGCGDSDWRATDDRADGVGVASDLAVRKLVEADDVGRDA